MVENLCLVGSGGGDMWRRGDRLFVKALKKSMWKGGERLSRKSLDKYVAMRRVVWFVGLLVLVLLSLSVFHLTGGRGATESTVGLRTDEDLDLEETVYTEDEIVKEFLNSAPWDLNKVTALHEKLTEEAKVLQGPDGVEGYSAQLPEGLAFHYKVTTDAAPAIICETGFNAGHGAATFMGAASEQRAKYYGFDDKKHPYAVFNLGILNELFGFRLTVLWGDSTITIPNFLKEKPDFKCDLIHIDGGHFASIPLNDLRNLKKASHANTTVLMNDVNCSQKWCEEPQEAWRQAKAEGWIQEIECLSLRNKNDETDERGFCYGRYSSSRREKEETTSPF